MLRTELGKILKNPVFYICILAVVVLLMSGNVYRSPDTGKTYTVFDFIFAHDRQDMLKNSGMVAADILLNGIDSYFSMFLPIIVAIPFVMVVHGENKNNCARFEIYRVGKVRYVAGRFFASVLTGGIVTMIGYIIFSILVMIIFTTDRSAIIEYSKDEIINADIITKTMYNAFGYTGIYIVKFVREFIYGALVAVPAIMLSFIIKNRYIIISVPFMIYYLLGKFIQKTDIKVLRYLLPETVSSIYENHMFKAIVAYSLAVIAAVAICLISIERKCDCGGE
ncbi:hypothetical protein ACTNBM_09855 [Lachnospiraceae bacterium HCP1S3_C3]